VGAFSEAFIEFATVAWIESLGWITKHRRDTAFGK
jgi:hypothetical protein